MRLLIDTHVLVWWLYAYQRIPTHVHDLIVISATEVFVSVATAWEIGIKSRQGRLFFDQTFLDDFDTRSRQLGFEPLGIMARHAAAGTRLPGLHKDPFDRLIAGQAIVEGLSVVTADRALSALGAKVVW